jgi:hypothetical protein
MFTHPSRLLVVLLAIALTLALPAPPKRKTRTAGTQPVPQRTQRITQPGTQPVPRQQSSLTGPPPDIHSADIVWAKPKHYIPPETDKNANTPHPGVVLTDPTPTNKGNVKLAMMSHNPPKKRITKLSSDYGIVPTQEDKRQSLIGVNKPELAHVDNLRPINWKGPRRLTKENFTNLTNDINKNCPGELPGCHTQRAPTPTPSSVQAPAKTGSKNSEAGSSRHPETQQSHPHSDSGWKVVKSKGRRQGRK